VAYRVRARPLPLVRSPFAACPLMTARSAALPLSRRFVINHCIC